MSRIMSPAASLGLSNVDSVDSEDDSDEAMRIKGSLGLQVQH